MLREENSNSKKNSGKRKKETAKNDAEEKIDDEEDNTEKFVELLRKGVPMNEILKELGADRRVAVGVLEDGDQRFVFSARIVVKD